MADNRQKVLVALSGGVDSSTAAAVLLRDGFDCAGVFMITSDYSQNSQLQAETVAKELGIELFVLDVRGEFREIIDYFCGEYRAGRTPNPCVVCNRDIKFGRLVEFASSRGFDALASGHYARVLKTDGRAGLYTSVDIRKDQTYALAMIAKDVLQYVLFPMGAYSKERTRQAAADFGLSTAGRAESQEICFVKGRDYAALLEELCPEIAVAGSVIDGTGRVLGEHRGIHRFTIGQRRGVGIAMGTPYYVVKIDAANNTVTLGPKTKAMYKRLAATGVSWLTAEPVSAFEAEVKIRYNSRAAKATVFPEGGRAVVEFDKPVWAITPGQLAVFYIREGLNTRVAGAGWIEKAHP